MNKISKYLLAGLVLALGCKDSEFTERYADPSKISTTTVEKQFTGFLQSNKDYVLPKYRNYFVSLRPSILRYTQTLGWVNSSGQYVPGSSGIEDVWFNYYNFLFQYRELERIYSEQTTAIQEEKKIFLLSAKVYLYDYTQRLIDLHGSIPFAEAGMLSYNKGNYAGSLPKFDDPAGLYTKMLDDLKTIATELNSVTLNAGYQTSFKTQDFVNDGSIDAWKRYANSLRLRLLNRVSGVESFKSRSNTEMAEILGNATTYPVVENNAQNILVDIYNVNTEISIDDFQGGIEGDLGWYGNTAGAKMMSFMSTNADPRLPVLFEPGASAAGKYVGIDATQTEAVQSALASSGQVAIYNRYTISRNKYLPGVLITASEVNLIKSEYYLRAGTTASAKSSYETAISQSVDFYNGLLAISNATGVTAPAAATTAQTTAYKTANGVSWDNATTSDAKLNLIATQKWIHFNIFQAYEGWAELRRLDLPALQFWTDNANVQTAPPARWPYPGNEITYNANNYGAVKATDNLTSKLFWDLK